MQCNSLEISSGPVIEPMYFATDEEGNAVFLTNKCWNELQYCYENICLLACSDCVRCYPRCIETSLLEADHSHCAEHNQAIGGLFQTRGCGSSVVFAKGNIDSVRKDTEV